MLIKVLLIDGDLRKPTVNITFKVQNRVGLTNILMHQSSIEDAIQGTRLSENLTIITSGPIPPNPSELLASSAMKNLIDSVSDLFDVVLIDTAGRLHNKINLMNELTKIKRVMQKVIPDAPHEVLLVLDGSTGQNAFEQAKQFTQATEVSSLAVTKLDGTAKGGVVIGISDQFKIPVKYIGVGEGINDLQAFNKMEFVDSFFKRNN